MKDTKAKTMKTKTKTREAVVAEPEMVYGRGHAGQWCLMPYFVPKKDLSFFKDMAKVRGWRPAEDDSSRIETVNYEPNACTVRAMKDALEGRVHHAKDAEDLLKQVGIGQKAKAKTAAPAKKQRKTGLERALEDVKAGRIHSYDSVDDMFNQILGKDWREKDKAKAKTAAPAKTARVKRSVAPKAELKRSKHLDESLRQIENGEYFEASSAEEMCEQIFGKEWRTK